MVKLTENSTSSPVTAPSPPVCGGGITIPPGCTELSAAKAPRSIVEKVRPLVVSRESNATSDGELTSSARWASYSVRVVRKHAVDLDDDLANVADDRRLRTAGR